MAYKYMDKWQKLMIKKNDVSGVDMTPLSTYTSRFIHLLLDNDETREVILDTIIIASSISTEKDVKQVKRFTYCSFLDKLLGIFQMSCNVVHKSCSLSFIQDLAPESGDLFREDIA